MTDEEAEEMLKALEAHYRQPVMPVKRYCDALRTWAECLREKYDEEKDKARWRSFGNIVPHLESFNLAISKSSLLFRLIYIGEKLRTKKCPIHKGRWSGLEFPADEEHGIKGNECPHGCNLTGWIHEENDGQKDS